MSPAPKTRVKDTASRLKVTVLDIHYQARSNIFVKIKEG
jgi:hypothetical protein